METNQFKDAGLLGMAMIGTTITVEYSGYWNFKMALTVLALHVSLLNGIAYDQLFGLNNFTACTL